MLPASIGGWQCHRTKAALFSELQTRAAPAEFRPDCQMEQTVVGNSAKIM